MSSWRLRGAAEILDGFIAWFSSGSVWSVVRLRQAIEVLDSGSLITKVNWQLANTLDETLVF